ncbi:hypothetical protein SUGI_1079290 [Cryptomeria japonica]|nr:hypothetical protein SUGI_1079290 [Cryptomeria japonica]
MEGGTAVGPTEDVVDSVSNAVSKMGVVGGGGRSPLANTNMNGEGLKFEIAFMTKIAWKLLNKDTDWSRIIRAKYLGNADFSSVLKKVGLPRGSKIWNNILSCRDPLSHGLRSIIGNGRNILFWEDCWLGEEPLASSPFLRRIQDVTKGFFGERVGDYFNN